MTLHRIAISAFAACGMCLMGQTPTPAGEVLGVGNFIHVVADLDKSIEFYRDAIGLDLTGAPGPHPFTANAVVSTLYDAPGQSRVASFRIPGSEMALEIVEFAEVRDTPPRPRLQDPGAITLHLTVRNLDAVMTRVRQAKPKIPVVTTGGEPLAIGGAGKAREVIVRDPDGIFVRLTQPDPIPPTTAPATANVIGAGFGVTVADTDTTLKIYREVLGFDPQADAFHIDEAQAAVMGTSGAQIRRTAMLVPGGSFPLELLEFKGIGRTPVHLAIHDPGASVLRLRVRDIDHIVKGLGAAGNPIVSSGGEAVSIGRSRAVIVREIDNLFLQPMQSQP